MAKVLTRRKQAWVESRKPEAIRGNVIVPNASVASRYYRDIDSLIFSMTADVEKRIKALFQSKVGQTYFAEDSSISDGARVLMDSLIKKFTGTFNDRARPIADRFANSADKASSSQVHSSLEQLSGGLSLPTANLDGQLKDILEATIAENVGLIRSIAQEYLTDVQGAVMRSITSGNGLQDLVPFLKKHKDITQRRAQLIALDQNRKAMNNLSRGRMENLGLTHFQWQHTGGSQEPRQLHIKMSGKIYAFDNPPIIDERTGERGFPGQAINCRCRMIPVITFEK